MENFTVNPDPMQVPFQESFAIWSHWSTYFADDTFLQELQSFTVTFRSEEVKSNKNNFVMALTSVREASLSHALRRRKNTILWLIALVQSPNGSRYPLRLKETENDVRNLRPCENPPTHKEGKNWYYCRYLLSYWTVLFTSSSIHILKWHAFR